MRNIFKPAFLAVAILLAGCTSDINDYILPEPNGEDDVIDITIQASLSDFETRAYFGDKNEDTGSYPVLWEWSDYFNMIEYVDGEYSQDIRNRLLDAIYDDNKQALFRARLTAKSGSRYDYYAYCCPYNYFFYDGDDCYMDLPEIQSAIRPPLLLTASLSLEEQPQEGDILELSFSHLAAYGKMRIKGLLPDNDNIISVEFSTDKALTGTMAVESGRFTDNVYNITSNKVIVYTYTGYNTYTTSDEFDIWFSVIPQERIDNFSIYIATENGSYSKNFVIPEGRTLAFKQGIVSQFTVDMSDAEFTADEPAKDNEIRYISNNNEIINLQSTSFGNIRILSNTCSNNKGTIVFNRPVTTIGADTFYGCLNLVQITLPKTITDIGARAFYGSNLMEIDIPDGVTSIQPSTFYNSTLRKINIPSSVTSIGEYAFYNCNIENITLPYGISDIMPYTFSNCWLLKEIDIPASVTYIGDHAFDHCDRLTKINIPDSVTEIGKYAFNWCYNLTKIDIPDSVTEIGEYAFNFCYNLTEIDIPNIKFIADGTFYGCEELKEINIPESVESIGNYAFYRCDKLSQITIPERVAYIGLRAFEDCYNLTAIYLKPTVPPQLPTYVNGYSLFPYPAIIYVPKQSVESYMTDYYWSNFIPNQIVGYDFE